MPRTKLDRPAVSCWERYRGVIMSRMVEYGLDISDMARRLNVTPPTMRKYLADPGCMTLDTMRKMNRALDVSAEDARANLAVK